MKGWQLFFSGSTGNCPAHGSKILGECLLPEYNHYQIGIYFVPFFRPDDRKRTNRIFAKEWNMRTVFMGTLVFTVLFLHGSILGKPLDTYINEAEEAWSSGGIEKAVDIMEQALGEYPGNPTLTGYLGGYVGMQAGKAFAGGNMNAAGELTTQSFELLDSAIELDGDNVIALFYRGTMGVNVPEFFGKLTQGIDDLETLMAVAGKVPDSVPDHIRFTALDALGTGYAKGRDQKKAFDAWRKIVEFAPGTPFAEQAEKKLNNMITSDERMTDTHSKLAGSVPEIGDLRKKLASDPDNPELLYKLGMAYGVEAENGYDERIYEDTTFLTNIAFEMVKLLDRAVKLAPDNMEIKLAGGKASVMMPFFVNRLDSGMKQLKEVAESEAPESIRAEARFVCVSADLFNTSYAVIPGPVGANRACM